MCQLSTADLMELFAVAQDNPSPSLPADTYRFAALHQLLDANKAIDNVKQDNFCFIAHISNGYILMN